MAIRIDGRQVAAEVKREVATRAAALAARGVTPHLAVVLVGEDPASEIYVRSKERQAGAVGVRATIHRLAADTPEPALLALIVRLNADDSVHGILVQLPLPPPLRTRVVIDRVAPHKDVDGLHPMNIGWLQAGRPALLACTPQGIMRLLNAYDVKVRGKHAVVLGRSAIVGRPMSWMLLRAHATVTTCHRHTFNSAAHARQADILISAVGKPGLVTPAWVKPGAVVIDVGINRTADGIVGDVEHDAVAEKASLITPVPGGVGPMTIAMLLANTCLAAERLRRPA